MDTDPKDPIRDTDEHEHQVEEVENIQLGARDIQVFRLIHEQRYLVFNQIKRSFWESCSETAGACHHRLEKLMKAGYLVKEPAFRKKCFVYFLTEKGVGELLNRGLALGMPAFQMNDYHRNNMDHDLKVTDIRIFFRKHGLDGWVSERVLKDRDFRAKVPDGILKSYGETFAIELENSTKGRQRYQEIFNHYRASKEYPRVFMIVNEEIKDWTLNLDYDTSQVWFVNYRDLLRKQQEAVFENKEACFVLARIL